MRILLTLVCFLVSFGIQAQPNLILVTIDGLRWQELFRGMDAALAGDKEFVKHPEALKSAFWHQNIEQRREKLMPFFWQNIAKNGVLIGNRDMDSNMSVANSWYFSYPGYNEIFTGIVDEKINSNEAKPNPNTTFVEYLNNQQKYRGRMAVFGSWDVFPAIFNVERSGLHVNAGFSPMQEQSSPSIQLLNELQETIPSPWHNVRLDAFTYRFAKHYLVKNQPKILVLCFGETDDFAHDGHYDQYLKSAYRTDQYIADLWHTLQNMPNYKDNTVLLITTDHGRGSKKDDWQHHASQKAVQSYMQNLHLFPSGIVGSEHTWLAALGTGVLPKGQVPTEHELHQKQIAATALKLINEDPALFNANAGEPIKQVFMK